MKTTCEQTVASAAQAELSTAGTAFPAYLTPSPVTSNVEFAQFALSAYSWITHLHMRAMAHPNVCSKTSCVTHLKADSAPAPDKSMLNSAQCKPRRAEWTGLTRFASLPQASSSHAWQSINDAGLSSQGVPSMQHACSTMQPTSYVTYNMLSCCWEAAGSCPSCQKHHLAAPIVALSATGGNTICGRSCCSALGAAPWGASRAVCGVAMSGASD